MIKYKINRRRSAVEAIEVTRETDKSVWFNTIVNTLDGKSYTREDRELKSVVWFNSFNEAKGYLIKQSECKCTSLCRQIDSERHRLTKILLMEEK